MRKARSQSASGALLDLLERERAALRSGRFDILERLAVEKTRLAGSLGDARESDIAAVQDAARRNAAMLEAAKKGVQSAKSRLARSQAPVPLRTYDSLGQLSHAAPGRGRAHRS